MRRPPDVRRFLSTALAHLVLVAFSAAILLPLLWVLRVSLTDKLTAYRIPPRMDDAQPRQLRHDLHRLPVRHLVPQQPHRGTGLDRASRCRWRPMLAYAFARYDTGGAPLRLAVLASQMLPPVVLVLPLFALFLDGRPAQHAHRP